MVDRTSLYEFGVAVLAALRAVEHAQYVFDGLDGASIKALEDQGMFDQIVEDWSLLIERLEEICIAADVPQ